jgi:hypothetical protein
LLLLLLATRVGAISGALHLWTTLTAHLILAAHFFLLILAAHTHLLLVMLRIHLLLTTHLLIHGILAVSPASLVGSFVAHPGLVSPSVLVVAVKIFSLASISGVLSPTFFAMFFTAHARSLTLTFSEVSGSVLSPAFFAMFFAAHSCSLTLTLG